MFGTADRCAVGVDADRAIRHSERVPMLPRSTIESMLEELCVGYGYCLPPEDHARLVADAPLTVDEFTDDVMRAEGMDPSVEKQRRREVRACVERWFEHF